MDWWIGMLIIAVIAFAVFTVFFVIGEREKQKLNMFDQSKLRLEEMSEQLEALLFIAQDNQKVYDRLKDLQSQILFATPSEKKLALDWDKRIALELGDLKIALARAKNRGTYTACNRIISQIELYIIERQEKID